ncbi:UNVERIFIED_CONTAM: hypothetical protein GTU68_011606 [Idotea baltica]|nr:hypothetical protein [Idotea baltica]
MKQLIECVPNFSEGRDLAIIKQITNAIEAVDGVKLLDVDPGAATNRTVVTFVGEPQAVINGALAGISKAHELIDMSKHTGEHPRFGACDVCPLIPIANISMDETVEWAHKLGKRIGEELQLSGYYYENAASKPERQNLSVVRAGEYEGLPKKLADDNWQPDFGPTTFNAKYGVTAVSARDFLIAYNINLNTTSTRRANAIAFDVREAGRSKREGNPITATKAIGWYIEEYGVAQISMNLTNITITSVHEAFEAVCESAISRGIRVTGSELVGLVPKQAMIDAGKHFLTKQERSLGIDDEEIIKIAVKSLGLDELSPFDPKKKIIEYLLEGDADNKLVAKDLVAFANETASESPAPGGGSISAYVGALGASLATMVANLSAHKRGWDERWEEFSVWAEKGQKIKDDLLYLVDEDTAAFNKILTAIRLPKSSDAEKTARKEAIEAATKYAIETPFRVMQRSFDCFEVCEAMAKTGLQASLSDAGVGALCARAAVIGAYLNVQINCGDLTDEAFKQKVLADGAALVEKANLKEAEILKLVQSKL